MNPVIVFDLDDTLYPEADYVLSGFAAVDSWLQEHRGVAGFNAQARELFMGGARGNIFDLALQKLGHPVEKAFIEELVRVYRDHSPTLHLFPDAAWAVHHFAAGGPIALLSDGFLNVQRNKFAALGIERLFHTVMFSDSLGREHWKPSPAPYQKIMEAIPRQPVDFVYVADNPNKDFLAPNRLGWKTIQISRPGGLYADARVAPEYRARREISSLRELQSL